MSTTPEQALAKIHRQFGSHPRHRALHAKGVHCLGTFTATPEAAALTKAGHMQGSPVGCNVRFSNGGGDPNVPDYVPDVRGLAVAFNIPGGERTDLLAQSLPVYPFDDQEGFLESLQFAKPGPAMLKLPLFAARNPKAVKALPEANRLMGRRESFAARRYFTFHAYTWTAADGSARSVRHFWHPTIEAPNPSKAEAKALGRDYLFDELRGRLDREPVQMRLEAQIAGAGDDPDKPNDYWSEDAERVTVGTLEVSGIDAANDDSIIYDPARSVAGAEPSNDPVLRYRPAVYGLSYELRTGA